MATIFAASIDTDTHRVHIDGGWASPYRRPFLLNFAPPIQFQAGLINVNALEGRSISLAGVAAIGRVAANADFYRTQTASKLSSISAIVLTPHSAIVTSSSLRMISSALATPPVRRRPGRRVGAADQQDLAPSASARSTSWPERMPPSMHLDLRADRIDDLRQRGDGGRAPSSWRPPWLETTIASAPVLAASSASSASRMPFRISLPPQSLRIHSTSSQFSVGSNCWPSRPQRGHVLRALDVADDVAEGPALAAQHGQPPSAASSPC